MEKKLEQGFTFQELASKYKMDDNLRKHMESFSAQLKESGCKIRLRPRKSEAEKR